MANDIPVIVGEPMAFDCFGEGICTCGAVIKLGDTNGHPTVMHPMPMCETFMRYESPIDYIKHLNEVAAAVTETWGIE